jgi:hypothetical protein
MASMGESRPSGRIPAIGGQSPPSGANPGEFIRHFIRPPGTSIGRMHAISSLRPNHRTGESQRIYSPFHSPPRHIHRANACHIIIAPQSSYGRIPANLFAILFAPPGTSFGRMHAAISSLRPNHRTGESRRIYSPFYSPPRHIHRANGDRGRIPANLFAILFAPPGHPSGEWRSGASIKKPHQAIAWCGGNRRGYASPGANGSIHRTGE